MGTIDVHLQPVAGALGAEILGLDLAASLDDSMVALVRQALLDHLVVFFRGQSISPAEQLEFTARFGEISRYPFVEGMRDYPDVVEVIKREDVTENFGGIWHSDTTYLEEPPLGSTLLARQLPPVGGDTWFANMYLAYEALSPAMRAMLDGLRGISSSAKAAAASGRSARRDEKPGSARGRVLTASHPVVRTHPETGRKALFVNVGHTVAFEGWTAQESAPVLGFLFEHLRRPEFTCCFRWRAGSMAFWDNRAAQHCALNDYHGYRRVMHRITIKGDIPR